MAELGAAVGCPLKLVDDKHAVKAVREQGHGEGRGQCGA